MTLAYVGLGANIGAPLRQLQTAFTQLDGLPNTRMSAQSGLYRSAPVGYLDQPEFLNAVAQLETELSPDRLLQGLQEIEKHHGRERPFAGAPRTLDLDLLLYGDVVIDSPGLTLPHPRMHERAFVLKPLAEIAPDIAVPGRGRARDLLAACAGKMAERIDARRG